jgi:hypothetical protein
MALWDELNYNALDAVSIRRSRASSRTARERLISTIHRSDVMTQIGDGDCRQVVVLSEGQPATEPIISLRELQFDCSLKVVSTRRRPD